METQQYSLSWNHFHSNLSIGFQSLYREQDLVDVTLAVDGKHFKAHKMVLSICSPYFKELFQVNPCQHPIVLLQDVQHRILKSLLVFMYQGEVKVSQHDLGAFMKLAEMLKVKGLTEEDGPMETEKKLDSTHFKDKKETSTNGLLAASLKNDDQFAPNPNPKVYRPKILKPGRLNPTKTHFPMTPPTTSTSFTANKRPKIEEPHEDTADPPLALRFQALQQAQTEVIERHMMQRHQEKQERIQLKLLTHAQQPEVNLLHAMGANPVLEDSLMVAVKQEPVYEDDAQRGLGHVTMDNMMLDMSSLVATSLGEGSEELAHGFVSMSDEVEAEDGHMTESGESSTPGRVMLLKSRRGLPVLIHDGHIYTKHKVEPTRTVWLCVKQRNLQCGGCLTTGMTEQNVLSFSGHNHGQLHDIIQRLQAAGTALGSGSSNCGSSSNSSPSHSHDRHDFPMEPTDLSLPSTQYSHT